MRADTELAYKQRILAVLVHAIVPDAVMAARAEAAE